MLFGTTVTMKGFLDNSDPTVVLNTKRQRPLSDVKRHLEKEYKTATFQNMLFIFCIEQSLNKVVFVV